MNSRTLVAKNIKGVRPGSRQVTCLSLNDNTISSRQHVSSVVVVERSPRGSAAVVVCAGVTTFTTIMT